MDSKEWEIRFRELKKANGTDWEKVARGTLTVLLGIQKERDRLQACHGAELGVCLKHCDEVIALAAALRKAYEPGVREELGVFCDNWVEAAKEQADAKRGGDWIEVICGLRTILARYSALPADVAELLRRVEGRKEE